MEIKYKEIVYDEVAIMHLYLENKWYAYTDNKDRLLRGIAKSLDVIGAYDDGLLVGLIRTVGDQETIVYIQDILVLPNYHRLRIGTNLMKMVIDKYPHVRQILLMTDKTEEQLFFYRSLGFETYEEVKGIGFKLKKQ
jgi:ribosomal protein S18 acetylase RimI-like enzyme